MSVVAFVTCRAIQWGVMNFEAPMSPIDLALKKMHVCDATRLLLFRKCNIQQFCLLKQRLFYLFRRIKVTSNITTSSFLTSQMLDNKHNINPLYRRLNEYSLIRVEECNHFNRLTDSFTILVNQFNNLKHF